MLMISKKIFNIISLFIVVGLLIGIAECILRVTHLLNAKISWAQPDALLGYKNTPNMEYWYNNENNHPISGRFNKYGYRDKEWTLIKDPNTYRIAVLGDSYVEAFQVETDKTFLYLTESKLNSKHTLQVELMNFGRSGFTQSEENIVLKNDAAQFSPDMVILFFLPENDIEDININTASNKLRPFYTLSEDDKLQLDTSFAASTEFRLKSILNDAKQRSILISFIFERVNMLRSEMRKSNKANSLHSIGGALSLCTNRPDETFLKNYKLNKSLIKEMAAFSKERGIRFMLVTQNNTAYMPEIEKEYRSIEPTFNADFFEDDLGDLAKLLNINYLGLQRLFTKAYVEKNIPLHWGHWNYDGHRVVAGALSKKLESIIYSEDASLNNK